MANPIKPKLSEDAKVYVTTALACFDKPTLIRAELKREYGVDVTLQAIEHYDPTKHAGKDCPKKYVTLFHETRAKFIDDTSTIGASHQATRLRMLDRIAARAESQGASAIAMQALEQIAKERGGLYTNRRELTGKDGAPLPPAVVNNITPAMTPKEAADAYADELNGAA